MSPTCRICSSSRSTPWWHHGGWWYRQCAACSAVWLDPLPGNGWAEIFYDQGYFVGGGRGGYDDYLAGEPQHRSNARARLGIARRFGATAPALWVDFGCSVGFALDETRRAGFTVLGIEASHWARGLARERFGLPVHPTLADAQPGISGKAAVVSMFQVLEHLPDPIAALTEVHACMRPGGLLLIETWDRGSFVARLFGRHWQQITPPSVLWLFDRKCLASALEDTGFRVTAILRTSKRLSLGWGLGLLAEKVPRFLAPAIRFLERSPLSRIGVTYRMGDLVTIVAVALSGSSDMLG